jgi:hypothetical protein
MGRYVDEGFIIGLKQMSGGVVSAAEDMGAGAIKGMSDAISNVSDLISNGVDAEPTIRPVLDLTNVQNGVHSMNGLFSNPYLSATSGLNVQGINANVGSMSRSLTENSGSGSNKDVVSEIKSLRDDVSMLGSAISKMKVVMDSGATVGAIETEIDQRMGARTAYKERRI